MDPKEVLSKALPEVHLDENMLVVNALVQPVDYTLQAEAQMRVQSVNRMELSL